MIPTIVTTREQYEGVSNAIRTKVAVESKLPRDNAKSNKAAAKKLSKTPEKVPEKDQVRIDLLFSPGIPICIDCS